MINILTYIFFLLFFSFFPFGFNVDLTKTNDLMNVIYHETTNFEEHSRKEQNAINRGETGVPPNSTGKLPRPQYQVNKLNKNSTNHFDYKIKGEYNGKAEVRRIETETIDKFKLKDPRSLPGNKGRH